MKKLLTLVASAVVTALSASAQGTAFNYQGRLNDGGNPATGSYDLIFSLYDANTNGNLVGQPITNLAMGVTNGFLSLPLDFGPGIFTGANRWLQLTMRTNGASVYTNLYPRPALLPTPYAILAEAAATSGSVSNAAITASGLNTAAPPASGQVLSFDGTSLSWTTPAANVGLTLPYSGSAGSGSSIFTLQNTGSGAAGAFLGNVGIGTAAPMAKLQIYGNSAPGPHIPSNEAVLSSGDGFHNGFMSTTGDAAVTLDMWNGTYGEVSTFNYATAQGLPLVLNSNGGNVGIGTTAPAAQLDVINNSNNAVAISGKNAYSGAYGQIGLASDLVAGEFDYPFFTGIYGNANISPSFGSSGLGLNTGTFAGYFDGQVCVQGRLGIGTPRPNAELDIEGSDDTGNFATPIAIIRNTDTGSAAAPALTCFGSGNAPFGVLTVTTAGTGLLARFGNANTWVADIQTNGTIDTSGDVFARGVKLTSDRNAKEKFTPVNSRAVLEKIAALPVTEWQYKTESDVRHIGPVAQDFQAAFQLSTDDKHISTVDEGGVALAAIQGLNQKVDEKDAEIQDLKQSVKELRKLVQELADKK